MISIETLCEQLRGLVRAATDRSLSPDAISGTLDTLIGALRLSEFTRGFKAGFGPYPVADDAIKESFEVTGEL